MAVTTIAAAPARAPSVVADIFDTAVAGKFTVLIAAVEAAGLVSMLRGAGPFTLFAPTDAAFAALPPGTLDRLMASEHTADLQALLKHHLVSRKLMAADLGAMRVARTLDGHEASLTAAAGAVVIAGARVVEADRTASNGVIHAIDAVMLHAST